MTKRDTCVLFEELVRVNRVLARRGVEVRADQLIFDVAAWKLWCANYRCLQAMTAYVSGKKSLSSKSPVTESVRRVMWHVDRCQPSPVNLPSGRVVMPNNFDIRRARVVPPTASDWEDLDIPTASVTPAVEAVRNWWVLVFATVAIPKHPVCRICEAVLATTPAGRRPRRDRCRACENLAHYRKLRKNPISKLKLRLAWKESKRRIRGHR